jgi:hypothetical protein
LRGRRKLEVEESEEEDSEKRPSARVGSDSNELVKRWNDRVKKGKMTASFIG